MPDVVKLDVPLFIRLLELAREDVKQDADLHDVAEAVIRLSQQGIATMANYDSIVAFMQKQGDTASKEEYAPDDIRRFKQIVDLADNGEPTEYTNTPKEEYAAMDAVTSKAGGGVNAPKHTKDIRGNSFRIYGDN
jgi:DNA-binding ferritin-like protein